MHAIETPRRRVEATLCFVQRLGRSSFGQRGEDGHLTSRKHHRFPRIHSMLREVRDGTETNPSKLPISSAPSDPAEAAKWLAKLCQQIGIPLR